MALVEQRPFTITASRALGRVVLTLRGELDVATAPALGEALRDLNERGDVDVVIDLAQLQFIDSRGLGVLLHGHRTLKERGGTLTLSDPRPHVRKVLEITAMTQVFTITQT